MPFLQTIHYQSFISFLSDMKQQKVYIFKTIIDRNRTLIKEIKNQAGKKKAQFGQNRAQRSKTQNI